EEGGCNLGESSTHIVPIIVASNEATIHLSEKLQEQGIAAIAIRPATVTNNSSRIRFAVTSEHTKADVQWAIEQIIRIGKEE
ncbi:aminotransferase class I/II-fold pyridoxal phosphate-dependent enzyme, partial [Bacillus pseudomycoides]|uniref:aminotransferase class I/II-fold pyridoxal phosphate-dependent enzyme n=1 Tax=Bacillus pseudomycoides TaxID=64104 RepID=UPI002847128D